MIKVSDNNPNVFEIIFNSSKDAILIIEGDQIIHCNTQSVSIFGCSSPQEMIGKTIWDFSPDFQKDSIKSKKKGLLLLSKAAHYENQIFDWLHLRKDGSLFDSEVNLARIDFEGHIYIQANLIDISERKKLEKQLIDSKNKAEESTRLKTSFLANMSHDIRNPLNAILGFSKMLAEDTEISAIERIRFGSLIESNGNKLLNLINDIIDVSLIEANQMHIEKKRCNVNFLLEELYLSFKKTVVGKDNIRLKLNIEVDDPNFAIFTDPMRLRQILSNLINNAIKYTNQGFIEFGYEFIENKTIQFFVKDSGIGISAEYLDNIFDRFSREHTGETKNIHGTGLGLDISKRLVGMLGGKIWVFSILNKGSEFYFSIPAEFLDYKPSIKINHIKNESLSAKDVDWSDKHILIADDDLINFELLKIILSKTKVKISKAINGKEAVDIIKSDQSIDLLLTDIQMPIMNGFEVIIEVKKIRPELPVIAQTAVSLEPSDEAKIELFNDSISKPIDVGTLISKIKMHLS